MEFKLVLTKEQVDSNKGFIVIWENDNGVSRITFETEEPADTETEYVAKCTNLTLFGCVNFGGLGPFGAVITFGKYGEVKSVEALNDSITDEEHQRRVNFDLANL